MELGAEYPPKFIMRVVSNHRTALSRQISEAVRIRRRGGAGRVPNSKAEYNRSHIPWLRVENEEEVKEWELEQHEVQEQLTRMMDREHKDWEQSESKEKNLGRKELVKNMGE